MLRYHYHKQNSKSKEVIFIAQNIKSTVLDGLPAGTDADLLSGKISLKLPDSVHNRAVYQDILQIALPASIELVPLPPWLT